MRNLKGIHHVTAITSSAEQIYAFFTNILGMRLVKKTVNQDDIQTYHLFFADDKGNPGTDMTFFDFQGIQKAQRGTNEISRTGFRVPNDAALTYWVKRFSHYHVKFEKMQTIFGRKTVFFQDFDEQQYALFSDEGVDGVASGVPWEKGPIPNEFAITGLGPIFFRVKDASAMDQVLVDNMGMRKVDKSEEYHLFEMGEGGNGASVILEIDAHSPRGFQGYGGVHHVAFRIEDTAELQEWIRHLNTIGANHSGYVDRFYFRSLYTRLYPGILFEFATEGPGFIDDEESYETLGELLALPPKFRGQRALIESKVRQFDTTRSNKTFQKEYF